MTTIAFYQYVSDRGDHEVDCFFKEKKHRGAHGQFVARLVMLQNMNSTKHWQPNHVKPMKGSDKIYEIRFKSQNIFYRPLGYMGPVSKCEQFGSIFSVLKCAYKNQKKILRPIGALETAEKRVDEVNDKDEKSSQIELT